MTSTSEPDLAALRPLALAALEEITAADTIGEFADHMVADDGVVTLRFQAEMLGYPGWFWTVAVAAVDGEEPTVLEAELLPGDDALVAPDWVPWSQRLEEYKAQQAAEAERQAEEEAAEASDDEDDEVDDDYDEDSDDADYLHAGDVDGVDIDDLDEDESDADDDESDADDDDD